MEIITKKEFIKNSSIFIEKIKKGAVFVYPTDTIYGLGCIATDKKAVEKLRKAKKMPKKPVSVIAPSFDWIYENCHIDSKAENWLKRLPGKYTLILKLKSNKNISENVSFGYTIGIRMPGNWFYSYIKKSGIAILTTSVNITGQKFIESVDEINSWMRLFIDFAIDDGKISQSPSTIVDLTGEKEKIKRR